MRNETRVTTFSILLNIVFEVLARTIREENELKRTQAEKEAVIFSLRAGGILMISTTELEKQNPKVHVEAKILNKYSTELVMLEVF